MNRSPRLTTEVLSNPSRPTQIYWRELAKTAQRDLKRADADEEKNKLWFIRTFAEATAIYIDAYRSLLRGRFYDGWCKLEIAERALARLLENPFIPELASWVDRRAKLVAQWQTTFPYRHFISPGMIYKRWACSICGAQSTPVEPCGHVEKRVYAGQLCYRRILEAEAREISLVTNPVQKYSVLQLDYRYDVVTFVLENLTGPFHPWSGEWTHKRQPHERFADHPPDGPCPCESDLHYEECCLPTKGVRRPHFQAGFASRRSEISNCERWVA